MSPMTPFKFYIFKQITEGLKSDFLITCSLVQLHILRLERESREIEAEVDLEENI